jgi:hypothetical protein
MKAMLRALYRFWFLPEIPYTMVIMRVGLCLYMTVWMLPIDLARLETIASRPTQFLDPSPVLRILPIPFPLPPHLMVAFDVTLVGLGVLATIGFCTRPALLLFAAGYWYMGAAISAWGFFAHDLAVPVQVVAVLAVAPGTTAWSVDRLCTWWWRRRRGEAAPLRSALMGPAVPRWGTQLILVLIAVLFLGGGVSKLRHGGLRWADGKTLGFFITGRGQAILEPGGSGIVRYVWRDGYSQLSGPERVAAAVAWKDGFGIEAYLLRSLATTELGLWVARYQWMLIGLSVFTLIFELAGPVVLFGPLLRNLFLIGATFFLLNIRITMPVGFMEWIPVFLCALDWPWLIERARRVTVG